jgi:tetratricopeptide (TPR) repeat protein
MNRLLLIVTLLIGTLPGLAGATAPDANPAAEQQARKSFESAEAHFKAGQFTEALREYQAGYDLYPLPGFLINIAQCQRRLGELEKARTTYRKFIMVAPDSSFVPEVKSLLAELDTLLAEMGSTKPASAAMEPAAMEPPPADAPPSAGAPPPTAAPAPQDGVDNPLVTAPAVAEPSDAGTRWWLWGTIGGVAVAAATTAVLLLRSPDAVTLHEGSVGTLRR